MGALMNHSVGRNEWTRPASFQPDNSIPQRVSSQFKGEDGTASDNSLPGRIGILIQEKSYETSNRTGSYRRRRRPDGINGISESWWLLTIRWSKLRVLIRQLLSSELQLRAQQLLSSELQLRAQQLLSSELQLRAQKQLLSSELRSFVFETGIQHHIWLWPLWNQLRPFVRTLKPLRSWPPGLLTWNTAIEGRSHID